MAIKGNKGEWSEFYALIKILTDRVIFAADENLDGLNNKFFTVLKIIRDEAKTGRTTYDITASDEDIVVRGDNDQIVGSVKASEIKNGVKKVFEKMKVGGEAAFSISLAEPLMRKLHCTQIRASSGNKADLILVIHDRIAPVCPELGFSIKSMLGSPATLLNASGATNFIYRVENLDVDKTKAINDVDGHSKMRDRARIIYGSKGDLVYESMENDNFKNNLLMIDSALPEILAELLKLYYEGRANALPELVNILSQNEEFNKKYGLGKAAYEFKIKNFLVAVALGMTPNKKWSGLTEAYGGYIVVKENGEIVCYHLYNRDEFQNYLYKNTRLETPSTGRHKFGEIYDENGHKYIKYNLQIRFNK